MHPMRCLLGLWVIVGSGATWGQTTQDEEDLGLLYGDKTFVHPPCRGLPAAE